MRRRVLVIDDDALTTEALSILLGQDGYEVQTAHSVASGLAAARAFVPDIVLCDLRLPDGDGLQLARQFRADPALAMAVLVAVTGHSGGEMLAQATAAGFHARCTKPIIMRDLLSTLAGIR